MRIKDTKHVGGGTLTNHLPCEKCGQIVDYFNPDPCIGEYLSGVAHACCGHGRTRFAYCCGWEQCQPNEKIRDQNKLKGFWMKRGQEALDYIQKLKKK